MAGPSTTAIFSGSGNSGLQIGHSSGQINVHIERPAFDEEPPPTSACELPSFLLSPYFTGRDRELQEIRDKLSDTSEQRPRSCVIHGMPGLGKTQLALQFATLASQRSGHPYVFWVSAASLDRVIQDFAKLADIVRLPGRHQMEPNVKITAMRTWLEDSIAERNWLLVLDNVGDETAVTLREILPRKNCGGSVLMTTRTASIADVLTAADASAQLALQTPGVDDAVAMLSASAKLRREEDRERARPKNIERLIQLVGHLPLAIDQAASYMRETGCSLEKMLDVYKSDEAPDILSWENSLSRHEEKSVVATFSPALDRIRQIAPDAVTLLKVLCFCAPESIPISILEQGCSTLRKQNRDRSPHEHAADQPKASKGLRRSWKVLYNAVHGKKHHAPIEVQERRKPDSLRSQSGHDLKSVISLFGSHVRLSKAIQTIQRLSLAAQVVDEGDRVIRIHDLVHLLLRTKLMTNEERRQWLEVAICIICTAFDQIDDFESPHNWRQCGLFVSHIESLESFRAQYALNHVGLLEAGMWTAVYLQACGLYETAATWSKQTLEQKKNILGEKHPSTLMSMTDLARVLTRQGKLGEAEWISEQSFFLTREVLGEKHSLTLTSMHQLALLRKDQGKFKEAEIIYLQILALVEAFLDEADPRSLSVINDMALVLHYQGETPEAEALYVRVLASSESILGKTHPDTLATMHNLAYTWKKQGRDEEAISLMKECLQLKESVMGPTHPITKNSADWLQLWEREGHEVHLEQCQEPPGASVNTSPAV